MRKMKIGLAGMLAALALGALVYRVKVALSCGPFFPTAYFTYSLHPDFPLDNYARGQVGIVQPTYAPSYLFVAYRYLSGKKLDADEQKAVLDLWHDRLANVSFGAPETAEPKETPWPQRWIEARKKVPGSKPIESIEVYRDFGKNYQQFVNCSDESFRAAIATLDQRIAQFGAESATVKDWLQGQDEVYANCTGKTPEHRVITQPLSLEKVIPAALQTGAQPAARADREYQIAAAYFYAADYDEAATRFQAIAQDTNSPWRQVARLLVARCLIRKATLSTDDDSYSKAPLVEARGLLHQILDDRSMGDVHASAQRLLDFVEFRLNPLATERTLANHLVEEHIGATMKQNLWDYTMLMDRAVPEDNSGSAKASPGQDLTDWLQCMHGGTSMTVGQMVDRWKQTRALPWLVVALTKVHQGQPGVPELLKAAEAVGPDSPGFASVRFHQLRLMNEANQADEVRARLDKLLAANRQALPVSALNLFLALRMKVSSNLDDWLRFAQRVPATISYDTEGLELPDDLGGGSDASKLLNRQAPRLDADSTEILNKMLPLNLLAQAAESKALTNDLRRQVAFAAWVRAVLLNDAGEAARMTPVLESLEPSLKDSLEAYRAEKSQEAAKFDAEYLMLKFPGARPVVDTGAGRTTAFNKIDDFRDNWWCLLPPEPNPDSTQGGESRLPLSTPLRTIYTGHEIPAPAFLTADQRAQASKDWASLMKVGVAPNFLAQEVTAWGKQHPDDPRVPEALYLAVRATRYGCTDKATAGYSKAAFQLLHGQYPESDWAGKTKYWYGGDNSR